jgi:hypothetical protein
LSLKQSMKVSSSENITGKLLSYQQDKARYHSILCKVSWMLWNIKECQGIMFNITDVLAPRGNTLLKRWICNIRTQ